MNTIHDLKDETAFNATIEFFNKAQSIIFNSEVSNEEAFMLQSLKEKRGYKLINKDAKKFQNFLNDFSSVSKKHLYGGNANTLKTFDFALTFGLSVSSDSQKVFKALENGKTRDAYINYMHPLEDEALENIASQHTKYEVGSEEGLIAMLADTLVSAEGKEKYKSFFAELDEGYICGESSVGEEEFDEIAEKLENSKLPVLIVGPDLYNHPRSSNIAKILGMISKYSSFEIFMVGSELNTLGVALICDLDEVAVGKSIGYRVNAEHILSNSSEADLKIASLEQEEGTLTLIDKNVLVLNKTSDYDGYRLNDIANALGLESKRTSDYTAKLPAVSGYKAVAFDDIDSGYTLEDRDANNGDDVIEDIDDISEFNGTIVYRCNHPLSLFNPNTSKPESNAGDLVLLGSKQFATAAKIKTESMVRFEMDGKTYLRKFKVNEDLKGTIAYNSVFDSTDNYDEYRYKRVNLEEINE